MKKNKIKIIASLVGKKAKRLRFSDKDIKELSNAISLPVEPLEFQKNIRNEW